MAWTSCRRIREDPSSNLPRPHASRQLPGWKGSVLRAWVSRGSLAPRTHWPCSTTAF